MSDQLKIPDDLKESYAISLRQHKGHRGFVSGLIERIAKLEALMRDFQRDKIKLLHENHAWCQIHSYADEFGNITLKDVRCEFCRRADELLGVK